jgi:inositol-polyphosphate multikinase
LPILEAIRDIVEQIRDVLADIEIRMVGSSLLIVYEGDAARAEAGVKWLEKQMEEAENDDDDDIAEVGEDQEDDSTDEEESDEEGRTRRPGAPFAVKIIDFAHTRLKPGAGPDKGVLAGFDTTIRLLEGRIEEVRALVNDK